MKATAVVGSSALSSLSPSLPSSLSSPLSNYPALEIVSAKIVKNAIKAILSARSLTQEEAARRVGISYRQMNRLALGHSDPSLLLAAKIGVIVGAPLDVIFPLQITTRKRLVKRRPRPRRGAKSPRPRRGAKSAPRST